MVSRDLEAAIRLQGTLFCTDLGLWATLKESEIFGRSAGSRQDLPGHLQVHSRDCPRVTPQVTPQVHLQGCPRGIPQVISQDRSQVTR